MASVSVGKPAIKSAPKAMSGRSRRTVCAKADRIAAPMPALHALQNDVIARLQGKVQMRHQTRLLGNGVHANARRPLSDRSRRAAAACSSGTWRRI